MKPPSPVAVVFAIAASAVGCGDSRPGSPLRSPASRPATAQSDEPAQATASDQPVPVGLSVSNQSFDDPSAALTINIDGTVVFDQRLDVQGQHNWVGLELALHPGEQELVARSDSGLEGTFTFTIPEGDPRYLVVAYWWYNGEEDEEERGDKSRFTLDVRDEPPGFA